MKYFFIAFIFSISSLMLKAQSGDFEVKVIAIKYATIKGFLKKVSAEGIGIEDYKGNYHIYRPVEIERLKIRKRGLTIGEGTLKGGTTGLVVGAAIWSLDENGDSFKDLAILTGLLTGTGAIVGTATGVVSEMVNTKLVLKINGSEQKFKEDYKKLLPYINTINTEHF